MTSLVTPWGTRINFRPERHTRIPDCDLRLSDGRQLVYDGPWRGTAGRWHTANGLVVLASIDDTHHGSLLHVSCSYATRDPSWDDIKAVRALFYPDSIDVMMMLPQAADYVNVHPHAFHLWQTPREWALR